MKGIAMTTDSAQRLRHRQAAWRGFDRITAIKTRPDSGERWWQFHYRSRCGTGCCYAGHVALAAGGKWLVHIRDHRMLIDDTPVTEADLPAVPYSLWQYMLATDDDPVHLVREVRGKRVIHVSHRAAHLIGLDPEAEHHDEGGLFESDNTRGDLERLIAQQVGPRP
ncbi:hypothetical protein ACQEUU_33990 [Nonomuraea sp. CA-218870]|uniref:Uncharacterized protein n=1 Tax=Nonomuraea corallina TaxID=2989783 RepID=A0ABT4SHM0_9ACTN|nr:hypothetical protein [Nonomuraea corallina]MDA0636634.1 hypothetical protein [Nonomuraea corallina]